LNILTKAKWFFSPIVSFLLNKYTFFFYNSITKYSFYNFLFFNFFIPKTYTKSSFKKNHPYENINFKNNHIRYVYNFFKKNFLILFFYNKIKNVNLNFWFKFIIFYISFSLSHISNVYKKTMTEGYLVLRGLLLIFFIDSLIIDDEPIWEPVEWSLIQTWIFFIFIFSWIAENLITSRYGSYVGRDKRVWFAWYKTFWLIETWFALSYGAAAMFVIVPFYYEITYNVAFIYSWWNWLNRIFFFKFISLYVLILFLSYYLQINIKWLNWKKIFLLITLVVVFLSYLLYTQFLISFFSYFTDPLWYQKTRSVDYVQLSHEPLKWGWGSSKRDHFTYHKTTTVFWFKNDSPFASAFLLMNFFFFLSLFFVYIYWLVLIRKTYTTKELTHTFVTYCVSSLRQLFILFLLFYLLVFVSFVVCYWKFPVEFLWILNSSSWLTHFFSIIKDIFYLNF